MSAIGPPWSQLTAYDLNSGKIMWQVPNGEMPGLPDGKTEPGSYAPRGGVTATAGGLLFVGTSSDRKIRAYDQDTGKVLWSADVPSAVEGVPTVYESGGRQYLSSASPADADCSRRAAESACRRRRARGNTWRSRCRNGSPWYFVLGAWSVRGPWSLVLRTRARRPREDLGQKDKGRTRYSTRNQGLVGAVLSPRSAERVLAGRGCLRGTRTRTSRSPACA